MRFTHLGTHRAVWLFLNIASMTCGSAFASLPVPTATVAEPLLSSPVRDEVIARIRDNYIDAVDVNKLMQRNLHALVREVDPEGEYLDADAMRELSVGNPELGGLGLELAKVDRHLKVVEPLEDSPAARAGLLPGDLIDRIDNEPVAELTLQEAVRRLRDKPGSEIKLSVTREGKAPIEMVLKWEIVRLHNVSLHALEPGYVVIRLSRFAENTPAVLASILRERYALNEPRGILLDLRNNTGGLLPAAVGVAAIFLPANSLLASLIGRHPDNNFDLYASRRFYSRDGTDTLQGLPKHLKSLPLVVLVNENTAAGAEIVAGALQDYKRALLIGSRTFGRASIQTILPLSNGAALKLTTARWHTPLKRTVHRQGLSPDVPSKTSSRRPGQAYPLHDAQMDEALALLKKREPKGD